MGEVFRVGRNRLKIVRPEVAQSWHRCRSAGVDPRAAKRPVQWNANELTVKLHRNDAFIEAALPVMRFLQTAVRGTGFILVLTDEDGIVLDFFGDAEILASAKENNYVPGCRHAEDLVGTNAIGLATVERRPIQLTGPEHYNIRHHGWTCASAQYSRRAPRFAGRSLCPANPPTRIATLWEWSLPQRKPFSTAYANRPLKPRKGKARNLAVDQAHAFGGELDMGHRRLGRPGGHSQRLLAQDLEGLGGPDAADAMRLQDFGETGLVDLGGPGGRGAHSHSARKFSAVRSSATCSICG